MSIFSGEPLPILPKLRMREDAELERFLEKLLDYLRRLGAKLDSPVVYPPGGGGGGSGGRLNILAAYMSANFVLPGSSTFANISWLEVVRRDAQYSIINDSKIHVNEGGLYLFLVDLNFEGTVTDFETRTLVNGTDFLGYGNGSLPQPSSFEVGGGTLSSAIPIPLEKDDEVQIQAKAPSATVNQIGTRLTVIQLHTEADFTSTVEGVETPWILPLSP